jgi:23S rRNA (cytosine1962-C5)-methyltransferase
MTAETIGGFLLPARLHAKRARCKLAARGIDMALSTIDVLSADDWRDYELLDSGGGLRLERFGAYTLARPDAEAVWKRRLPEAQWAAADATFQHGDSGERWTKRRPIPAQWPMHYGDLTFYARLPPFKHTGVFPEQAALWGWMRGAIAGAGRPVNVLTLFGYTGLMALAAAAEGARVTYLDASKWAMDWARENQAASKLEERPIRWLLDDALKFVKREARRGVQYDAILADPPSFGRGPKGEVWKFAESFPPLLDACVELMSERPLLLAVTGYATELSSLALGNLVSDSLAKRRGHVSASELTINERGSGRQISTAVVARWTAA